MHGRQPERWSRDQAAAKPRQRILVTVTEPNREMHSLMSVGRSGCADKSTRSENLTSPDPYLVEVGIGGAQAPAVTHGDREPPRHRPGEGDGACGGDGNHGTGGCRQVDAQWPP